LNELLALLGREILLLLLRGLASRDIRAGLRLLFGGVALE
jgi:hypothetical protein